MFHAHTLMKSRTNHTPVPPWVSHPQDDTCTDKIQEEDKLKVAKKKILLACQMHDWTVMCDGSANKENYKIGGAWVKHKVISGIVRRVGRMRRSYDKDEKSVSWEICCVWIRLSRGDQSHQQCER
mmetsp:Transcript_11906/g.23904  ORF Transcript_11906/g.23904 Transcript_11906/m.23904 type:complete len:125 (-) Transcript_11906:132-506(-)